MKRSIGCVAAGCRRRGALGLLRSCWSRPRRGGGEAGHRRLAGVVSRD
ncbi:hypothetical protein M8494_13450 [Serratia ureilytica]